MEPEKIPSTTIINGGVEFAATMADGSTQKVLVRLIPISKAGAYYDCVGEIAKLVELACDKEAGWADQLADDSLFAIDEIARKINDPRFDRFLRRQKEAVVNLIPKAREVAGLMNSLRTQ